MTTATYAVVGMSCQHCVDAVTAELGRLPGVEQVTVDLPAGAVQVEPSPARADDVRSAVDEAGYDLVPPEHRGRDRADRPPPRRVRPAARRTFGLAYGVGRAVGLVDDDPVPHDAPVVTTTHAPEHEGMGS
ncbi:MAG: heavy-metal-associated domain-containing protein [Acidimicrobiales bacterium]